MQRWGFWFFGQTGGQPRRHVITSTETVASKEGGGGTHENAQDGEEGRGLQGFRPEPFDRAFEVVRAVLCFGRQRPRRFVARGDVDAAEEDRVEFDFDVVLREQRALLAEVDQREVAVW